MNQEEILKKIEAIENEYSEGNYTIDQAEGSIRETLKNYRGEDRVVSVKDFVLPLEDEKNSFYSGIEKLDKIYGRLHKGDIFTITAPTNHGKSAFARELFIRFSQQNKHSLFFAYEDTNYWFIKKLGKHLTQGYIPLVLNDRNMTWIEARILEAIVKYNVEVVFIDNVKSITEFKAANVNNSLEAILQKIKDVAVKYNIMIFLCAHVKKERNDIDINSIKDSSAIADGSSLVIAIKREIENGEDTGITTFSVIKNRNNGKLSKFVMKFVPDEPNNTECVSGRFEDTDLEVMVQNVKQGLKFNNQEDIKIDFN